MEAIVILQRDGLDDEARSMLEGVHRTQEFSDRVFVIEGDRQSIDRIRMLPGITTPEQLTPGELGQLSVVEQLSIVSWGKQSTMAHKSRTGDNAGWGRGPSQNPD